jgi:hypothetical protein
MVIDGQQNLEDQNAGFNPLNFRSSIFLHLFLTHHSVFISMIVYVYVTPFLSTAREWGREIVGRSGGPREPVCVC